MTDLAPLHRLVDLTERDCRVYRRPDFEVVMGIRERMRRRAVAISFGIGLGFGIMLAFPIAVLIIRAASE